MGNGFHSLAYRRSKSSKACLNSLVLIGAKPGDLACRCTVCISLPKAS